MTMIATMKFEERPMISLPDTRQDQSLNNDLNNYTRASDKRTVQERNDYSTDSPPGPSVSRWGTASPLVCGVV